MKWGWIPLILYLGKDSLWSRKACRIKLRFSIVNFIGIKRGTNEPGMPQPTLFR